MLYSLGQPVSFIGLVIGFFIAVMLRALAIRITARVVGIADRHEPLGLRPRHDIDIFGLVAAAIGGMGWGKALDVDEVPAHRGRGRRAAVYAAGPVVVLVAYLLTMLGYVLVFTSERVTLVVNQPSDVLGGVPAVNHTSEFVLSIAIALLCFVLLDLVPLPPLDGWGLLWSCMRQPGANAQKAKLWLADNNLGVAIVFLLLIFPFGSPFIFIVLNLLGSPLLRLWA